MTARLPFPWLVLLMLWIVVAPTAGARELLDIWHVPLNAEPPGHSMREPNYPAPGQPVSFWLAVNVPGTLTAANFSYRIDNEPVWQQLTMTFELQAEGHEYWLTTLSTMYPQGTVVRYYIAGQGPPFDDTFVYGDNETFFLTGDEQTARDGAFEYVVGTMPTPTFTPEITPTRTPTSTPWITSTPSFTPAPTNTPTPQATDTPEETPAPTTTPPPPTPTNTETPTNTGTPTPPFTPTPTPLVPTNTPTTTPSPSTTFTPEPTQTPVATPTGEISVDLTISDTVFSAGERFLLYVDAHNYSWQPLDGNLVIMLDVYGDYWFYPSWTQTLDGAAIALPAGHTFTDLILDFYWPDDSGTASGIFFWGALITQDWTGLIGDYDRVEFGYE